MTLSVAVASLGVVNKKFSGFRSRWTILCEWQYLRDRGSSERQGDARRPTPQESRPDKSHDAEVESKTPPRDASASRICRTSFAASASP